ncbi:MAG: phosphoribosylglycinamide formyltransferase [Lachnospiraceae bacterium]|nr:phosphoribosylglycinamide formyltransferase [Lachnospiraceae bacterium]
MKKKVRKLAVLASGSGTTLQAVIKAISQKELDMEINVVVSDNPNAFALIFAETARIKTHILTSNTAKKRDEELLNVLKEVDVDMVLLAGYLKLIGPKVLDRYTVINTHPSLLPKYGGKGMYGMHVHAEVVKKHEKESGVTLHFVNEEYDKGQIIWQTHVPVYAEDCAKDVSDRVQAAEKTQLVSILKAFSEGKIEIPDKKF